MQQVTVICFITTLLLVSQISALQKDTGNEDYGPVGASPPGDGDGSPSSAAGKADSSGASGDSGEAEGGAKAAGEEAEPDPAKTKFTDDRFAKLFPARAGGRNFVARNVAKPKPTLPSFIKSTPPLLKVQVSTTPVPKGLRARATVPTTKRSSSALAATTARPRRGGPLQPSTQRALTGRLSTTRPTTAPNSATASATPSAAALAAARRARQGNGISRFNRGMAQQPNSNSTIPALNPRRN